MNLDKEKKTDNSYPARRYMPWARWLVMFFGIFVVILVHYRANGVPAKIGSLVAYITLFLTYYPIKQKFFVSDGDMTALLRAKANFFGYVSVDVEANGQRNTQKLGKIGYTTTYMQFTFQLGDGLRHFTLINLINTKYFLLSERSDLTLPRISIKRNVFCF